jgi:hypothetical protein
MSVLRIQSISALTLLATCISLGLPFSEAISDAQVSCFNRNAESGHIGVWAYEGQSDWRTGRATKSPVFVFSFSPGRKDYQRADLRYCGFLADVGKGSFLLCKSGSVQVTEIDVPNVVSGSYSFVLEDGQTKSSPFRATYCPPSSEDEKGAHTLK